jgi:hypothetical protein
MGFLGRLFLVGMLPAVVCAQETRPPTVRLEGGMLNASDPLQVTLAYGGSVGWDLNRSNALLVRYVRQSQNRNSGEGVGGHARGFLTANWEHGFKPSQQYQRQVLIRVGVGALFRYLLATAPVITAGLEVRYAVRRRLAFIGSLEDDMGRLPRQDFQSCSVDAFGNVVCTTYRYGDLLQHNFGFLVAAEWRP